jgi:hypothetical protein
MFASRLSRALMILGAGVGVLTIAILALEVQVNLPDWMVRVAMIKLAFIAAGGLLAGGALLGRHARLQLPTQGAPPQLGEGEAKSQEHRGSASRQPINRRSVKPE